MPNWTEEQLAAIEHRGASLIISAAAGSGKTAVLVERLLRHITTGEDRRSIDEFVVITYTRAAAGDIRAKIIDRMGELLIKNPNDRHIQDQIAKVYSAKIKTVHSFCGDLIRTYGYMIQIPSDFSILDPKLSEILLKETLNQLFDEKYEQKNPEFLRLVDAYSVNISDWALMEIILDLYHKSRSHPFWDKFSESCLENYHVDQKTELFDTKWGQHIKRKIFETARLYSLLIDDLLNTLELNIEAFEKDGEMFSLLCQAAEDGYEKTCEFLSDVSFDTLKRAPKEYKEDVSYQNAKNLRDEYKKEIRKLQLLVSKPADQMRADIENIRPFAEQFFSLTGELISRFESAKLEKNALDYSDLEHFAIRLLVKEYDIETDRLIPSDIAKHISGGIFEIMVDEYQDSNAVQDLIFRAVSKEEKNLVMVGDMKQSIYRFRLADPNIFKHKFDRFLCGKGGTAVTLSKNFRSQAEVLDAANFIMEKIMSRELGDVDYDETVKLYKGAGFAQRPDCVSEVILIDTQREEPLEPVEGEEAETGEDFTAREKEAAVIANRIRELIDSGFLVADKETGSMRPVTEGDIVILLRSVDKKRELYEKALKDAGIVVAKGSSSAIFSSIEFHIMFSFLSVISNPQNDVCLISTLRSPFFLFTADELCNIRREDPGSFYAALKKVSERESQLGEKVKAFFEILSHFRVLSEEMSPDRLISKIYSELSAELTFSFLPNGQQRVQNLLDILRFARQFVTGNYAGLFAFLNYITKLADENALPEDGGDVTEETDGVRIMTVHKSKGLEFPVVFYSDISKSFNKKDLRNPVLIHTELGLGIRSLDEENRVFYPNFTTDAMKIAMENELLSEELRLVYVAMTRPIQKLIVTICDKNLDKKIQEVSRYTSCPEAASLAMKNVKGPMMWMLFPALAADADRIFAVKRVPAEAVRQITAAPPKEEQKDGGKLCPPEQIKRQIEFVYPFEAAVSVHAKATVTEISKEREEKTVSRPLSSLTLGKEKTLTPAQRGILLHKVFQFIRFQKWDTPQALEEELDRLLEHSFFTPEELSNIDRQVVFRFCQTDLYQTIIRAEKLRREFQFSILAPARIIDENCPHEEILLQGVIDLFYEDEKGLHIVDFKTDAAVYPEALAAYKKQLELYGFALGEIYQKPILSKTIAYITTNDIYSL